MAGRCRLSFKAKLPTSEDDGWRKGAGAIAPSASARAGGSARHRASEKGRARRKRWGNREAGGKRRPCPRAVTGRRREKGAPATGPARKAAGALPQLSMRRVLLPPLPQTALAGAGQAEQPGADREAENALLVTTKCSCGPELDQGITGP